MEEVDKASTYLAHIPLEDYGPSLQLSEENNDNLSKLTDDFSVTALKVIFLTIIIYCEGNPFDLKLFFHNSYKHYVC